MNQFLQYLQNPKHDLYEYGEFTNATCTVYIALGAAVLNEADTFIIYPNYFEWSLNDEIIGKHLGKLAPMPQPVYPLVFKLMQARDEIVNTHSKIIEDTGELLKVSLVRGETN